jgi:hypothetical protein
VKKELLLERNKREILQSILDQEEELWIIIKPSRFNPIDSDYLCVFQNPAEYKETRVEIPTSWFQDQELNKIREAVRSALKRAEPGYTYT